MPKFPPNANFSMDNPLIKLASTSNLKSSALMKEKEWVHDYELKTSSWNKNKCSDSSGRQKNYK